MTADKSNRPMRADRAVAAGQTRGGADAGSAACARSLWRAGGALLAGLLLALPAAAEDSAPATLFYDAHVFTAEAQQPYAEAVAIRGGRILAVGALAAVEQAAGPEARRVDLQGNFLMPGMIDAHAHPIMGGLTQVQADFRGSHGGSIAALARAVTAALGKPQSRQGDVLVVNDIDLGYWSHAAQIDAVLSAGALGKTPIVLFGEDGHTGWANRLARTRAGITAGFIRDLPEPQRRYYGFDAAFNPNGFVVDAGLTRLKASLPPPSPATLLAAGEAAMRYLNGLGITAWLDGAVSGVVGGDKPASADEPGFLPAYQALAEHGELTAHVAAYPVVKPDAGLGQIDVVESLRQRFADIPDLTIPGLKVFADGVAEFPSQTAALTRPYRNSGRSVPLNCSPAALNALMVEAYRRGLTVHVHAIGDLAVKAALDAFEAAHKANPDTALPFVLTHAQFVAPEDIPRFAGLHVFAALQLLWAEGDESTIEQLKPYVDPQIYRWMYPARSILDAGGVIAGASDWPVSSANPFEAIAQAETRRGPEGVLDASQRVPREAMLYAYTRDAAAALGRLAQIGTLAPGKRADLALIDRDVLTVPAAGLGQAKVVFTMFGGRVVHGREP
jgi:predicted amidohydrolase YtcJ